MNVVLTERDITIFSYLNEQKYMTLGQIQQIFWSGRAFRAGAARRRVQKLRRLEYLKTIELGGKCPELILLAKKGIAVLRDRKLDHGLSEIKRVSSLFVSHTLKLVAIRALFLELGQGDWKSERMIRRGGGYRGSFPDAILDVCGNKIAIEFENSKREKKRYLARFRHYWTEQAFTLVIYIITWPMQRNRLLEIEHPPDKLCFVEYEDLMQKKGAAELENAVSKIRLDSIL